MDSNEENTEAPNSDVKEPGTAGPNRAAALGWMVINWDEKERLVGWSLRL
jgi:hypothetical protein